MTDGLSPGGDPVATHEFEEKWKLLTLQEAVTMEVRKCREREPDGEVGLTAAEQETEGTAIELLDRIQRKVHGHRSGQPLRLEFFNKRELVVAISAILGVAHLVDKYPEFTNERYDPKRCVRACVSMATDFERLHPSDAVIEHINIKIPEVADD